MNRVFHLSLLLALLVARAEAFSLLGPYEPWMDTTNGFRQSGDIGGPMPLGCGYRWNVPTVTYGFDQSFLDYFGTNGTVAVESAIAILNALPDASTIVLTNYPMSTRQLDAVAQSLSVLDLKSAVLVNLVEQLGLADPERYVFALRQWSPILAGTTEDNWPSDSIPNYIIQRSYDPITLQPSSQVNTVLYSGDVFALGDMSSPYRADIVERVVDPLAARFTSVATSFFGFGENYSGLTYDDVGGLRYLLSAASTNIEQLLPGVRGTGTNAGNYVDAALRPGVGKITFIPHPADSLTGLFLPLTNQFVDTYITNGTAIRQTLERAIIQPDFLFTARDLGTRGNSSVIVDRTGTTNWLNCAALNGSNDAPGPGIIRPPVTIAFNTLRKHLAAFEPIFTPEYTHDFGFYWGLSNENRSPSDDLLLYPLGDNWNRATTVRVVIYHGGKQGDFQWQLTTPRGASHILQASGDLKNWETIVNLSNDGAPIAYTYMKDGSRPLLFFRCIPAP